MTAPPHRHDRPSVLLPALLFAAGASLLAGCTDASRPALGPVPGAPPLIFGLSPDTLQAGLPGRLTGVNLGTSQADVRLTVGGAPAEVGESSGTDVFFDAPSARRLECEPPAEKTLTVEVAGRSAETVAPVRTADPHQLEPGGDELLADPALLPCQEIEARGARHLLAVYHPDPASGAATPLQVRGRPLGGGSGASRGGAASSSSSPAPASPIVGMARGERAASAAGGADGLPVEPREMVERIQSHRRVLEGNLRYLRENDLELPPGGSSGDAGPGAPRGDVPRTDELVTLRIPFIFSQDPCESFREVTARAAYVGDHAVIFEDTTAALAGQMDDTWRRMGMEYDAVMHPLVEENFGSPTLLGSRLDGNQRVYMLFSPLVNVFQSVSAFVWPADFAPTSECASSDRAEIFYAGVPTVPGDGFTRDTPEQFRWRMRSTLVHEVKHLASLAQRIDQGASRPETAWLEEATAMVAEELFARKVFGYDRLDNTNYRQSVFCELRPGDGRCEGLPLVMFQHWLLTYAYHARIDQLTPLGPATPGDVTFFGSSWNLVRWAIDQSGRGESEILGGMNRATATGLENLSEQTGLPVERTLGYWSATQFADDHPDVTFQNSRLKQPSWNTRDIFNGLFEDLFFVFPVRFPLAVHPFRPTEFEFQVDGLPGGSATYMTLDGLETVNGFQPEAESQLVEIGGLGGGAPAADLRGLLLRIE